VLHQLIASIIGSGINGNVNDFSVDFDNIKSLLLLEVELMETFSITKRVSTSSPQIASIIGSGINGNDFLQV